MLYFTGLHFKRIQGTKRVLFTATAKLHSLRRSTLLVHMIEISDREMELDFTFTDRIRREKIYLRYSHHG